MIDRTPSLDWKQSGDNGLCKTPLDSVPGSPSKCSCQILPGIAIPVPGIIKVDKVTNPASDPTSFSFTLSGGPQSINTPFTLTDTTTPFDSGPLGVSLTQPYSVVESVPQGWTQSSATCVSDQSDDPSGLPKRTYSPTSIVLHNGETVTCTFNNQKLCPSCPANPACGFYTCDASSNFECRLNNSPSTTVCRPAAGECDVADNCTGSSPTCPADAKQAAGTACTDDGNVCTRDICDGSSNACTHPAGNAGTTCRASAGECDPQEVCDGVNTACPADAKSTAVCRPSAGICDVEEKCDGVSNDCPTDAFQPSSTACRPAAGDCDVAENCTGSSAACPTDGFKAAGALCSFDADACITSQCNGSGDCVAGNPIPITGPGTPCASDGECETDGLCAPPNTCICAVSGSGGGCVVRKAQN